MAYMTYFYLDIPDDGPTYEQVADVLACIRDGTPFGHERYSENVVFWSAVLQGENDASWSDQSKDMKVVSDRWPNVLFTLRGRGDEQDDQWIEYHINGRMHREERGPWTHPEFDPAKLDGSPNAANVRSVIDFFNKGLVANGYELLMTQPSVDRPDDAIMVVDFLTDQVYAVPGPRD